MIDILHLLCAFRTRRISSRCAPNNWRICQNDAELSRLGGRMPPMELTADNHFCKSAISADAAADWNPTE